MAGTFSTYSSSTYTLTTNPTTVTSAGTIDVNSTTAGVAGILGTAGVAWTLTNLGTVESIGSQGLGIDLLSGGLVTNGSTSVATATIKGGSYGIEVNGAAGTVVNYGTITSTATGANGNGVYLKRRPKEATRAAPVSLAALSFDDALKALVATPSMAEKFTKGSSSANYLSLRQWVRRYRFQTEKLPDNGGA
jgi:hypothetical protein